MTGLKLRGVRKSYDAVEVIKGVDLDIAPGEFVVFVGPSGCGKSTLLRMIAGLEEISGGDLFIGDTNDENPVVTQEAFVDRVTERQAVHNRAEHGLVVHGVHIVARVAST